MSKLSQTTSDRRELNSLLKQQDESAPRPIASQGAFSAYLNCVAVVVSRRSDEEPCVEELWAADLNGVISIRNIASGQPLKDPKKPTSDWIIPALDAVAITGIAQAKGGAVWCIFLDGYVRGFNALSKELLFEHKKHTGALHAICTSATNVFTAGDDFRISMWSTNADGTPNLDAHVSLKAHTSSIRAMATAAGEFIYTGSDDGLVRCWSLKQKGEVVVPGQYPIHAVSDGSGIKTIAIHDNAVFVACKYGVIAYDIETCEMLHRFSCGSPVIRMAVVAADITLWCACADGAILVFDLLNYELIGRVDAHVGALIRSIEQLSRSTTNRLFLFSTRGVTIVRADISPAFANNSSQSTFNSDELRSFVGSLNARKEAILQHHRHHRAAAAELRQLERNDRHTKNAVVTFAAREHQEEKLQTYLERGRVFFYAKQHQGKLQLAAKILARHTWFVFVGSYFRKLLYNSRLRHSARHRDAIVHTIHKNISEGLRSVFTRETIKHQRKNIHHEHCDAVAQYLSARVKERLISRCYHDWHQYLTRTKHRNKFDALAHLLQISSAFLEVRRRYFGKFLRYFWEGRRQRLRDRAVEGLEGAHARLAQALAAEHGKFLALTVRKYLQQTNLVGFVASGNTTKLLRRYFCNWKTVRFASRKKALDETIPDIQNAIRVLDAETNDESIPLEETLDAEIAALEAQISAVHQETTNNEAVMKQLTSYATLLAAERSCGSPMGESISSPSSSTSDSGMQTAGWKINAVLSRLKPKCLNWKTHGDTIQTLFKVASLKPAAAFMKGVERWRTDFGQFAATPIAEGPSKWPISSEQISRSQRSTLTNSLNGVRELIVAWDVIVGKGNGIPPTDVKHAVEILLNAEWVDAVADRLATLTAEQLDREPAQIGGERSGTTTPALSPTKAPLPRAPAASKRAMPAATLPPSRATAKSTSVPPGKRPATAGQKTPAAATTPRTASPPGPKRAVPVRASSPPATSAAKTATGRTSSGATPTRAPSPRPKPAPAGPQRAVTPPASPRPTPSPKVAPVGPRRAVTPPASPRPTPSPKATTPVRTPRGGSASPSQRAGTLPPKPQTPRAAPASPPAKAATAKSPRAKPAGAPAPEPKKTVGPASRRAVKAPPKK